MIEVKISIPDDQWGTFKNYYLTRRPISLVNGEPTMSVGDWIKQSIVDDIYQVLGEGKQMLAWNELDIDISIT